MAVEKKGVISDRAVAVGVRAALLALVDLIEQKWLLGKHAKKVK